MADIFLLLTPVTYWILIIMWAFILGFYLRKLRGLKSKHLFFTLISILAIDAFRTLFESVYFGFWYTSLAGFIPAKIGTFLMRAEMVIIPKLLNVFAATLVIILLLKRWIPQEEQEKSRIEEAFRVSEEKFAAFTNQSFECISVADEDGNYTYVNPAFCKMMGYTEAELLKLSVFDMKSEKQNPSSFAQSKKSHEGEPLLVTLRRKDGTQFPSEIMGKLIEYGGQTYVLGAVRDITERIRQEDERKSFERKVQHTQKLESLGVLAGGIAHDFNNLLTAILGNANLALDSLESTSPVYHSIQSIEKASLRAADLAMQMLAYSGRGKYTIERINTRELVEEISNLLEVSVSKINELQFNFADDSPDINGDASQIRQVIMNLITNASEATGDRGGVITLSTGLANCSERYLESLSRDFPINLNERLAAGDYSFIEVRDTGCGMNQETIDRMFEPFFTTKFTGRGLGMAAVHGILRGHRGTIDMTSEEGKGSCFKILFPAVKSSAPFEKKIAPVLVEETEWRGSGTIILADDDESVREIGERILKHLGFEVLAARNGLEAVSMYQEHNEDVVCVLLDLTMPQMGGTEALNEIKKLDPNSIIILCSGYDEQDAMSQFEGKSDGFLHKPYQKQELRSLLMESLAGREDR